MRTQGGFDLGEGDAAFVRASARIFSSLLEHSVHLVCSLGSVSPRMQTLSVSSPPSADCLGLCDCSLILSQSIWEGLVVARGVSLSRVLLRLLIQSLKELAEAATFACG